MSVAAELTMSKLPSRLKRLAKTRRRTLPEKRRVPRKILHTAGYSGL